MITIRPATYQEFDEMAEKGREFHQASAYRDIPYDVDSMINTFEQMLEQGLLLVAEADGRIIGGVGGVKFGMFFNVGTLVGCERFWWLDPNYRNSRAGLALLKGIEAAAKAAGCLHWMMLALDGDDVGRATAIYDRFGYIPVERAYMKRIY